MMGRFGRGCFGRSGVGVPTVEAASAPRIAQPLCKGPLRNAAAKALEKIRRGQAVQVTLGKEG